MQYLFISSPDIYFIVNNKENFPLLLPLLTGRNPSYYRRAAVLANAPPLIKFATCIAFLQLSNVVFHHLQMAAIQGLKHCSVTP